MSRFQNTNSVAADDHDHDPNPNHHDHDPDCDDDEERSLRRRLRRRLCRRQSISFSFNLNLTHPLPTHGDREQFRSGDALFDANTRIVAAPAYPLDIDDDSTSGSSSAGTQQQQSRPPRPCRRPAGSSTSEENNRGEAADVAADLRRRGLAAAAGRADDLQFLPAAGSSELADAGAAGSSQNCSDSSPKSTPPELENVHVDGQEQYSSGSGRPPGSGRSAGMNYTRGHWRPFEDEKLRQLVAQHGPQNWNVIAQQLQGRSGKSCRLRWFNQLDPRINRAVFSEEEEGRLIAAHRLYGNKWALIARLFPGRTDNAVKNHWHVITARRSRASAASSSASSASAAAFRHSFSSSSNSPAGFFQMNHRLIAAAATPPFELARPPIINPHHHHRVPPSISAGTPPPHNVDRIGGGAVPPPLPVPPQLPSSTSTGTVAAAASAAPPPLLPVPLQSGNNKNTSCTSAYLHHHRPPPAPLINNSSSSSSSVALHRHHPHKYNNRWNFTADPPAPSPSSLVSALHRHPPSVGPGLIVPSAALYNLNVDVAGPTAAADLLSLVNRPTDGITLAAADERDQRQPEIDHSHNYSRLSAMGANYYSRSIDRHAGTASITSDSFIRRIDTNDKNDRISLASASRIKYSTQDNNNDYLEDATDAAAVLGLSLDVKRQEPQQTSRINRGSFADPSTNRETQHPAEQPQKIKIHGSAAADAGESSVSDDVPFIDFLGVGQQL